MSLGEVYGRGTVIELLNRPSRARLACRCGVEYTARRNNVVAGRTRSCGCIATEQAAERAKTKALRRVANRDAKAAADVAAAIAMRPQEEDPE
jgi:hypothetical protein